MKPRYRVQVVDLQTQQILIEEECNGISVTQDVGHRTLNGQIIGYNGHRKLSINSWSGCKTLEEYRGVTEVEDNVTE